MRIFGVGQRQDMLVLAFGPLERGSDGRLVVGIEQQLRGLVTNHGTQIAEAGGKDMLRQAKGGEQFALRFTADAGDQRQAQPSSQCLRPGIGASA